MSTPAVYPEEANGSADGPHPGESLELRVRRLEDAVAALQDTSLMEERITRRLLDRVPLPTLAAPPQIIEAPRPLPRPVVEFLADYDVPTHPAAPPPAPPMPGFGPPTWLPIEMWREFKAMMQMHFDPRYRMTRTGKYVPWLLVGLMIFSGYLFNGWVSIPFVSPLADKLFVVFAAVLAYKILSREVDRYHEHIAALTFRR
jgi:hypothetical protein